jgi:hypothetical protein
MRVLDLIKAINRFYVQQVEKRRQLYRDSFEEFPYRRDTSNIVKSFMLSLFPLMGSSHRAIANMAWQVFRQ